MKQPTGILAPLVKEQVITQIIAVKAPTVLLAAEQGKHEPPLSAYLPPLERIAMNELMKLLKINPAPVDEGRKFIVVSCGVGFEPHGRASETWEIYWTLVLPQIPYHWKSTNGWRRGSTKEPISFKGRTFDDVVSKAKAFLRERNSVLTPATPDLVGICPTCGYTAKEPVCTKCRTPYPPPSR